MSAMKAPAWTWSQGSYLPHNNQDAGNEDLQEALQEGMCDSTKKLYRLIRQCLMSISVDDYVSEPISHF
jgi:hypothetical protein